MSSRRLHSLEGICAGVDLPAYKREQHAVGIVHIGVGAFHRAHQAVYTDDALAHAGGDWRIVGISLRGTSVVDALAPQKGLYTLLIRGEGGTQARVVGSLAGVIAAVRNGQAARDALLDPNVRIVSLTVTEKAYGIDRRSRSVDQTHPAIAHDLTHPDAPTGVIGMIVHALRRRRSSGIAPFTVLCCDNLPENGRLLRAGVIDFASRLDRPLAKWIAQDIAFPSTMVDRITPASSEATLLEAKARTGFEDFAAVETEAFNQWVIEDCFPAGRPAWDQAGVLMVKDVAPYERMKLRMLNGAHSLLAYVGNILDYRYVRDAMQDGLMVALLRAYMAQAAKTLGRLEGVDFKQYEDALIARFSNPAIAHEIRQIAMDGTEKLPQRILAPAGEALANGQDIRLFAFAVAAWMRHCLGASETGRPYELDDPRAAEIRVRIKGKEADASALARALLDMPGLFSPDLLQSLAWKQQVIDQLAVMLSQGMRRAMSNLI
ncbi:mannitol dehydrogenase family protein [Allopusillimonas ginsengisoli]|nr:mannitol dehydrogenase family protein [Allopusillimonas ginsengisoli]